MVKVKICGITNKEDAQMAVECGADALGFIFAESSRRVTPEKAEKIIMGLAPWTARIGVFVNEKPARILKIAAQCGLTAIQLHGDEAPSITGKLKGYPLIKAIRVATRLDLEKTKNYAVSAYLFDTKADGKFGGSGLIFDHYLLKNMRFRVPIILSGGLTPKNVTAAVKKLSPYGVDVSSGVESRPGKKDFKLVKEFIKNAKAR